MSTYSIINPYDETVLDELTYTSESEAMAALEGVREGLASARRRTAHERASVLKKLTELLRRDAEIIAQQITAEIGKTITDSRVEVQRAAATFECAAEEARRNNGETLDSDAYGGQRGKWGLTTYQPIGVVLAITPFNFPINLPAHKIGPAFAAGNTILFKPGPQNYLSARLLTQLCHEAGMTQADIALICPDVPVMEKLIAHPDIACISFTGGTQTAKAIAKNAGLKKLLFELGGNDPLIVMPDADLELAATTTINQRFQTAGQRCTACKRLFIHAEVYERFRDILVSKTATLKVGDPTRDDTVVGPVVSARAATEVEERIQQAKEQGATVLSGGSRKGNVIEPTIIEDVPDACLLIADETFGPVAPLLKFDSVDDLVRRANGTEFGLQSGVFTRDLGVVKQLFERLDVGAMAVNDGPGFRAEHFPFGGVKHSGLGREGVRYAMREMSHIKTLIL